MITGSFTPSSTTGCFQGQIQAVTFLRHVTGKDRL